MRKNRIIVPNIMGYECRMMNQVHSIGMNDYHLEYIDLHIFNGTTRFPVTFPGGTALSGLFTFLKILKTQIVALQETR